MKLLGMVVLAGVVAGCVVKTDPLKGPQGEAGPAGDAGAEGATGPTGPAGPQGDAGPMGAMGVPGAVGPTGPVGPAGQNAMDPWAVCQGGICYSTGSVGIGTTAPGGVISNVGPAVHVKSSTGTTSPIVIAENDNATSSFFYTVRTGSPFANNTIIENDAQSAILLNPFGGNVGIGTTSPGFDPTAAGALTIAASPRPAIELVGNQPAAANAAGMIDFYNSTSGNPVMIAQIAAGASGSVMGGSLVLTSSDTTGAFHNVVVDPNGNVGIGTTNPSIDMGDGVEPNGGPLVLMMNTPGFSMLRLTSTSTAAGAVGGIDFGSTGVGPSAEMRTAVIVSHRSDSNTNDAAGDLRFFTNDGSGFAADPNMMISNNGNVGIGTTSPTHQLHVAAATQTEALYVGASDFGDRDSSVSAYDNILVREPARTGPGRLSGVAVETNVPAHSDPLFPFDYTDISSYTTKFSVDKNGSVYSATGVYSSSDARLKQNIAPLPAALSRLLRLRGVTFEWKDPAKHGNLTGTQIGMIAQEVEQVFPEWVGTDADGYKTLTYRGFEALTVESFRELKAENDALKASNGALQATNAELAGEVAAIKERLSALEARGGAQHASVVGDGRWFGGLLLGASLGLAPWWLRRRRQEARRPAGARAHEDHEDS